MGLTPPGSGTGVEVLTMSDRTADQDEVPDLPDSLDGLPDDKPEDSPSALDEPGDPDAHGPMFRG